MLPEGAALRVLRALAYIALTLPLMPVQALFVALKSPFADRFPVFYHRLVCRILGIEIACGGVPSAARPTLFIANHTSYLDIEILAASVPASFVSKADIGGWPLFGGLARLQRTVFIDRKRRTVSRQRDAIAERLEAGGNLILFPEGTSGDGQRVLPFKSALFAAVFDAAQQHAVAVQPVSVAYLRLDGMPLGRAWRPYFAWYGDMDMLPHLWAMLGLGRLSVAVDFHPAVAARDFASRKDLAEHCERVIAAGLSAALAGRGAAPPQAAAAPAPAMAAQ
jgi:lyso-ornithine lipid O-acyltransferase